MGDFLADNRVSRLKVKRDYNKELYIVDTILTAPDTNKLIVSIKL